MIKHDAKYDDHELDIMLMIWFFFTYGDTEEEAISGLYKYLMEAKNKNIFVQHKTGERIWHHSCPDYKGRVGQAVIYLGITLRTHTEASLNNNTIIDDTIKVVKNIQSLGLSVRDKINIIKAAGQSRATYGAA
eukprot:15372622-Heterocapsa_arctica.AAC.1